MPAKAGCFFGSVIAGAPKRCGGAMSKPAIDQTPAPALVAAFELRCQARALLWHAAELELFEAVDKLWDDAQRDGLVDELGQDRVQQIIADAFAPYRASEP